jgi:protein-S-isoprenylcysteine O-methyltransferase
MKKIITGILVSIPFFLLIAMNNFHLLLEWKVIVVFVMGVVASYYQAEYHPFKVNNLKVDKGTVLQIIWTVYLTQTLALLEAFYVNSSHAFRLNSAAILFLSIAVVGLIFRSWAFITLGNFFTMHLETKSEQTVIENGPYKFLRHPSYTGAFLTYIFTPLFLESYYSALLSAVLLFWAFYRRINLEEEMLLNHMGETYRKFCEKRARLIPFIW